MKTSSKLDAPLPAEHRRALYKMVTADGEKAVLSAVQVTRHALARCLAGLPVRAGTRALVERAVAQHAAKGAA